ncbi:hypothetical protein ACSBR1_020821 [Camellia fascicularis]
MCAMNEVTLFSNNAKSKESAKQLGQFPVDRNFGHLWKLDMKGANILVGPNGSIKLADFGMAKNAANKNRFSIQTQAI